MTSVRCTKLLGIGKAVPEHSISQQAAAALARQLCVLDKQASRQVPILYARSRIDRRGSVLLEKNDLANSPTTSFYAQGRHADDLGPDTAARMRRYAEESPRLAVQAAEMALAQAYVARESIRHLVTVSCTGFEAPGFDLALIRQCGLSPEVSRTHIGFMGCHGVFNALRAAKALTQEDGSHVLICSVELCSLHFAYKASPDAWVPNALFADGAAAAILGHAKEENPAEHWTVQALGSMLFPDSADVMTWRIGNHGFEMTLSPRVPELIQTFLKPWVETWLGRQGLQLHDVRSWAIHPGGPRILDAVTASLALPEAMIVESRQVLADHGNMSSATILFILDALVKSGKPAPCVALGFGPGLTVEAALLI
jgi:predicted naringenin-chalcone synthase